MGGFWQLNRSNLELVKLELMQGTEARERDMGEFFMKQRELEGKFTKQLKEAEVAKEVSPRGLVLYIYIYLYRDPLFILFYLRKQKAFWRGVPFRELSQ